MSQIFRNPDVLLVAMPFGSFRIPSLGLSLLRAALLRSGVETAISYFNINFARAVGPEIYDSIVESAAELLLGEALFAKSGFDTEFTTVALRRLMESRKSGTIQGSEIAGESSIADEFWADFEHAHRCVEPFLDECVRSIIDANPRIVGLTSTFQQNMPCFALARRIKALRPDILVIMGGGNCEAEMGLEIKSQCSFVDAVHSGEGDEGVAEIVKYALAHGCFPDDRAGLFTERNLRDETISMTAVPIAQLDNLPMVDFDDYYQQLSQHFAVSETKHQIAYETSRGCWWGQKHHCTFCGLNGSSLVYRSKSPEVALAEIEALAEKYPGVRIMLVDNILDMRYFNNLIPALAERTEKIDLFWETKANLRKSQVALLKNAGVTAIQPGIESLSTQVLGVMRKGVTALQNIQLLKWGVEFGIEIYWNVLWGFPGEAASENIQMAEMMPLLSHLKPPSSAARIRLDRFSPNFEQSAEFGFANVSASPAYSLVYDRPAEVLKNLAYYFTFDYDRSINTASTTDVLSSAINAWRSDHLVSDLFYFVVQEKMVICDSRPEVGTPRLRAISGLHRVVYEICDEVRGLGEVVDRVRASFASKETSEADVSNALQALVDEKLMLVEDSKYLSLAVPVGYYRPRKESIDAAISWLRGCAAQSVPQAADPIPA